MASGMYKYIYILVLEVYWF